MPKTVVQKKPKKILKKTVKAVATERAVISVGGTDDVVTVDLITKKKKLKLPITPVVKRKQPPTVTKEPVLVSVSFDETGASKIARYSGLFFVLVGTCFAASALGQIYTDTNTSDIFASNNIFKARSVASVLPAWKAPISTEQSKVVTTPQAQQVPQTVVATSSAGTNLLHRASASTTATTTHVVSAVVSDVPNNVAEASSLVLQPAAQLQYTSGVHASGTVTLTLVVPEANEVALFAVPANSLTERYIGTAIKFSQTEWRTTIDSTQIPNGDYMMYAKITNKYGSYKSNNKIFKVANANVPFTIATTTVTDTLFASVTQTQNDFDTREPKKNIAEALITLITPHDVSSTTNVVATTSSSTKNAHTAKNSGGLSVRAAAYLSRLESSLQTSFSILTVTLHSGDTKEVSRAKARINAFTKENLDQMNTDFLTGIDQSTQQQVRDRFASLVDSEVARIERREQSIVEKFTTQVTTDTDHDGVSDFDELHTTHTNSTSADTDSDGYTDGAEFVAGFNPNDAALDAVVMTQSPESAGPERPDILSVRSVAVLGKTQAEHQPQVLITGKGLPNSFIFLYLYPSGLLFTAKTDAYGVWNYVLGLTLGDGRRQLIAAYPDNAGSIIAKSKVFTFTKHSDIYTFGSSLSSSNIAAAAEPMPQGLFTLAIALGVVSVGLLLIIIGSFLSKSHIKPISVLAQKT